MLYKFFQLFKFIFYALSSKRKRRLLFCMLLILFAVLFLLHNKGYCAQEDSTYTTDTSYFIIEQYDNLCDMFKISFDKNYGKGANSTARFNAIFEMIQNGQFIYFYKPINNTANLKILNYDRSSAFTYVDTSLVYNDGIRVPSTAYNFTWYARQYTLFY